MIKLESTSKCVLGLSFNAKEPLIVVSLGNGQIEVWDYQSRTLIKSFHKHNGAARCVSFHKSQKICVSGGDDRNVKVWNYETGKSLITLKGHTGGINTVEFHDVLPWILTASDDKYIRIWNWQSRTCISELIGHKDTVMCASFHPTDDVLVSASLDSTVRGWGFQALRKKADSSADGIMQLRQMVVFEGHVRGVNWACFHPEKDIIISASMDRSVRIWDLWPLKNKAVNWDSSHPTRPLIVSETKAWKVRTLLGHMNSVSAVMFHAKKDIIVSSSEDKCIRVWDARNLSQVWSSSRQHDRFLSLAVHPELKILAAGHDNGMIVVKLESDRPAFGLSGAYLFYSKLRSLWCYNFTEDSSVQLSVEWPLTAESRSFSPSPKGNALLVCFKGSYELYTRQKSVGSFFSWFAEKKGITGKGNSAVFISATEFAVLVNNTSQVIVKNLQNQVVNESALPVGTSAIFYGGTRNLLCISDKKVVLVDLTGVVLAQVLTPSVKYVVWSSDMERVALLSKHTVIIASKNLMVQCILRERIRVKGGAWDDYGVFIYTTMKHIKFCLPNGDSGIIKALDIPIYIIKVAGRSVIHLDRDGTIRVITIDSSEYLFKLSVLRKRLDDVMSMAKNPQLCSQGMSTYLQQNGLPEIALQFVEDEKNRFNMAIETGNIDSAVAAATKIGEKCYWSRLGEEALRQGNVGATILAYEKMENYGKLSFLRLITGNVNEVSKLMKTAGVNTDITAQFHNALYLGDVEERVKILENAGHLPLAYVTASVHGLKDTAERLATELGDNVPVLPQGKTPRLLIPPPPIVCGANWPLV